MMKKLGKREKRIDNRTLQLNKYTVKTAPPPKKNWLTGIPSIPMYLNDTLGCCVIACMAHMLDQWSYLTTGKIIGFTNDQITAMYTAIGGYNPHAPLVNGQNPTDNGCDMLTAMKYWRTNGFCGHKIAGFAEVNTTSPTEFERAICWYGSITIGVNLPLAIQSLSDWPAPPNLVGDWAPGSWGGHCVDSAAYFPGTQTVETWGSELQMSDVFFKSYCDEAYVVFFPGWVMANGQSPSGLNVQQLQADLAAL